MVEMIVAMLVVVYCVESECMEYLNVTVNANHCGQYLPGIEVELSVLAFGSHGSRVISSLPLLNLAC